MLDIMYIIYISKYIDVYFEGLDKNHVMLTSFALTSWSAPREVNPTFRTTPPGLQFLRKLGPNFQNTGLEIEPRFPAKPLRRKSVPNLGRSWGESSLQPFGCKLVRLQRPYIFIRYMAIATPNGPFGFWILDFGFCILDFGFWILDFGFWILDFGFRILDQFSLRSFCGGPKRPRLDFGFWISDFGFWISDFGFWILGLSAPFGSCIRYFLVTPTRVGGFPAPFPSIQKKNLPKFLQRGSSQLVDMVWNWDDPPSTQALPSQIGLAWAFQHAHGSKLLDLGRNFQRRNARGKSDGFIWQCLVV